MLTFIYIKFKTENKKTSFFLSLVRETILERENSNSAI